MPNRWVTLGRKHFENFNISSVAQFTEKKLLSFRVNGSLVLSEAKLRAVVENAKLVLKVINYYNLHCVLAQSWHVNLL